MGSDEKWKKAAMTDDTMVAEMLLRLNKATPTPTATLTPPPKLSFPFEWSVRQRRSKSVSAKKPAAQRASPTTPLSWSGATSYSGVCGGGTIDGCSEESSKAQPVTHPKRPETARSKVISEATTVKRPRKKKALAELKQDEILLLEERNTLKRQLETLRVNLDRERETNENLKKQKLDLESRAANERKAGIDASMQSSPPKSCSGGGKEMTRFVLPDLNLPFDEDIATPRG